MEKLLSVKTVAEYLGLSVTTIYDEIQAKNLPAYKIGGSYRVTAAELQKYLDARKTVRR